MTKHHLLAVLVCVMCAGTASATNTDRKLIGDQLTVPEHQARHSNLPQRGLAMERVEKSWGAPTDRIVPVGEPPIARWIYDDFTVYFEHQNVIHAVVHRPH